MSDDNPKPIETMTSEEIAKQIQSGGAVKEGETPKPVEVKKEEKKEELILGKFKTPDEVVKSYPELEKKLGEQGQEIGKLRKQEELRRQQLSQVFELDTEGNIIGTKKTPPPPTTPDQEAQLSMLRPYFPGLDDQAIMGQVGLMGMMVKKGLDNFYEDRFKPEIQPLHELRFERDVEKQKKQAKDKYKELYDQNESVLNERLNSLPPDVRAKQGAVETLLLTAIGEKTPDLIERARQEAITRLQSVETKKDTAFVEGAGKSSVPAPPIDLEKMSSEQIAELIKNQKR